jgi:hypothetical protein
MVRVARNGAGREALAGVVAVAAQTVGAARGRRSRRARGGGGR